MRILHVVHQYVPDHVAGTELYTQSVARRQTQVGYSVAVFTPLNREGSFAVEPAEEAGVRVYRAPAGRRGAAAVFRSTFGHAALASAFAAVLSREQPDIVHLQHLMGLPAAVSTMLHERGIPYVISLHDYWYGCANGQLLTNDTNALCAGPDERFHNCGRCAVARAGLAGAAGLLGPLAAPVLRRRDVAVRPVFAGARRVLAPNDFVRQIHMAMGFPDAAIVINPLGLDAPPGLAERIAVQRASRASELLRLGYVGSIGRQKGLHVLVEAMNGLPEGGITLDIYGDPAVFPEYASELRALGRHPGINFNGPVSRQQIWTALGELDALVMPTLWYEASPATIREAFAAGLPVIASDLGAPGSMIRDGIDGLLFPPGDVGRLRSLLRQLIAAPERLDQLRAGIPPVRSESEHVEQILAVYGEALRGVAPTLP